MSSIESIPGENPVVPIAAQTPTYLSVIEGGTETNGGDLFENYLELRDQCVNMPEVDEATKLRVQEDVRDWISESGVISEVPDYGVYSRQTIDTKIGSFLNYLAAEHSDIVPMEEIEVTRAFVNSTFALYQEKEDLNGEVHPDADGSFAFVVPARMSRKNSEYGEEVEPTLPAFKYIPNELRAQFMIGLPPFIIDVYKRSADGRRGYLVLAPVFSDMMDDIPASDAIKTARNNINNAVDFAQQRLGVETVGLGAVLPALTRFGKEIKNDKVNVTTGHGGTAYLVKETVVAAVERGEVHPDAIKKLGILGLGSIGASIAELIASEFPSSEIRVFDSSENKTAKTTKSLTEKGSTVIAVDNQDDLINGSDIIVSAITSQIDLSQGNAVTDLEGKFIVDDSQPGCFQPDQIKELGGKLSWVIAKDTKHTVQRTGFDYGTMADGHNDLFGCEAEAAVLSQYSQELKGRGMPDGARRRILAKVAIHEAVTPQKARIMGALFRKYGIAPSEFQSFGNYLTSSEK